MKSFCQPLACASVIFVLAGCASTPTATSRQEYSGTSRQESAASKVPRPERIIVRDFAATATEVAPDTPMDVRSLPSRPLTAQQEAVGRRLGAQVANELAANLRAMGLPAVTARGQPAPLAGDLVLTGYFALVQEGRDSARMAWGLGERNAKLETHAEGWWMTPQGLQRDGRVASASGRTAGATAPLVVTAVTANPAGGGSAELYRYQTGEETVEAAAKRTADEIAMKLRPNFEQQGWVSAAK